MLVTSGKLIDTPVISVQSTGSIGTVASIIMDPTTLKILAFRLSGPLLKKSTADILTVSSIREYSHLGIIVDSIDELVSSDDVVKISEVLSLNFNLIGLKVESKKGSHLGRVNDFTVTPDDFAVQQIIVKRPLMKSFLDPELTIPRHEIVEVTDYKLIVKDEEKVIKARAEKEDFVPNFVNPFRKERQPAPAHAETENQKTT